MAQRHMDRLTSFDTSFLTNEKSNGHMAIGAIMVCEGAAPSYEDFVTHIRSRLHLLPRLRQRVQFPPLRMGTPLWVDHPEFDVHKHVRHVTLPAPGTDAQFHELIGEYLSPPLDRSKPLWELWLTDGFEDNRFGIIYKTHHAMADGISATDVGMLLFDVEPKHEIVRTEQRWEPNEPPSRAHLLGLSVRGFFAMLGRSARWVWNALKSPRRAAKRSSDGIVGLWEVGWNLTKPAPKVAFNTDISPSRSFTWTSGPLGDFKTIKNALGGTVNDVTLAVAGGALRRWLEDHRNVDTDQLELQALVPVSVRTENDHGELGNRLTAMRGPLPVHIADPYERLRHVTREMEALKASKQALGAEAIWGLNDWFREFAPPLLLNPTATINFSTRLFNMLVTNFPGPQVPFYVLGRELTAVYPIGFLARRHALAVAMFSYNGAMHFGLLADGETIEDLESIAGYMDDCVQELLDAAGAGSMEASPQLV
ncbi:MAG: wax ester/triacylglycerol synthase family O-acyltransferase [Solirubrobacterales bacterium]